MKNIFNSLVVFLVLIIAFNGCRKGDDPTTGKQCYPLYLSKLNGNDFTQFKYDKDYRLIKLQRTISDQRQNNISTYNFYYAGNNLDSLVFTGPTGSSYGKYKYDGDKLVMSIWYSDTTGTGVKETGRVKFYYKENKLVTDTGFQQRTFRMMPITTSTYEYDANGNLIHWKQYNLDEFGGKKFASWQEFQYNDKVNPYYGLKYLPINMEYWSPNYRTKAISRDEAGNTIYARDDDKKNIRWNDAGYPTNFDYGSFTYDCK